jgi:hypothetical protein
MIWTWLSSNVQENLEIVSTGDVCYVLRIICKNLQLSSIATSKAFLGFA